ncbi:MAG: protein kinase, partial [Candidatus Obscuribacterales bacterium]|nr:protein kinase [Candidatus Obscuribacterales bacterium]
MTDCQRLTDPLVGMKLRTQENREFSVLAFAGRGRFANVYKALDLGSGATVALKVFYHIRTISPEQCLAFVKQEAGMGKLKHPNIVVARSFCVTEEGVLLLVMEFIEGTSITQYLETNVATSTQLRSIFLELSDALDYANRQGVTHPYLRSAEIMLCGDESGKPAAKIIDFGARLIAGTQDLSIVSGDFSCMSPEELMGKKRDFRANIYSLGCIMFECIYQRPPF